MPTVDLAVGLNLTNSAQLLVPIPAMANGSFPQEAAHYDVSKTIDKNHFKAIPRFPIQNSGTGLSRQPNLPPVPESLMLEL